MCEIAAQRLPNQLTSFVGRRAQINDVRKLLATNRLVTLTGTGGAGKTRLALQLAAQLVAEFGDDVYYVALAAITEPNTVPVGMARALGLTDVPGRSTMDTLERSIGDRRMLVLIDNCEHLLDASAALLSPLLRTCPNLTVLATSREPIGVAGEVTWRVPLLSLTDEAIVLFADRARQARSDFRITDDNRVVVSEICLRLDGLPLAIEMAAARVRALSPTEIRNSLHDRFRLLTGATRNAVHRQHTLRASVDWSHELLTEPERTLFRRLSTFFGGFDLDAALVVGSGGGGEPTPVVDLLTLLVDKSLVLADNDQTHTRYRLLETVRQYAQEKLTESGEAAAVRNRHRDHYTAMAALVDNPSRRGHDCAVEQAEAEIDNLRAAFAWSQENRDLEHAVRLASSLLPLWLARGRFQEGLTWMNAMFAEQHAMALAVRARLLSDHAVLNTWSSATDSSDQAELALKIARDLGDPVLLLRAFTACCRIAVFYAEGAGRRHFAEATTLARELGDDWRLSEILGFQSYAAFVAGDPAVARAAADEGLELAETIGDRFTSRWCRTWGIGSAHLMQGELAEAAVRFDDVLTEAGADGDVIHIYVGLLHLTHVRAYQGETVAARVAADAVVAIGAELGGALEGMSHLASTVAALAAGDIAAAEAANEAAWQHLTGPSDVVAIQQWRRAEGALGAGDLIAARRWADQAVLATMGFHRGEALTTRVRIAIVQGEPRQAERDAHEALSCTVDSETWLNVPGIFECLASLGIDGGSQHFAARLLGSAHTIRQRMGLVRFAIHQRAYDATVENLRNTLGNSDFDAAWAAGAALSLEDAISYAQRGRGERTRAASGWESLTPAEREVVSLVTEGLPNKDIAARLFVSPRTVQSHLTHVYTKLGLTSRVQLVREAARHVRSVP
ncbi:MAG: hypothetical protein QOE62_1641 [Actinomycetota bacterium]|jgi:predicted ATPase/DNA-binding CsgD family transcriptional regulator|nr:hypothetical protein [Actinomycetota bacterium]